MMPLRRYADFGGRSSRAEFWKYCAAVTVALVCFGLLAAISMAIVSPLSVIVLVLFAVAVLASIIPRTAVTVRRLHDINRSGYWYLGSVLLSMAAGASRAIGEPITATIFNLANVIVTIILLVWWCLPGTPGDNDYGPNPYGDSDLNELAKRFE
jgi:uncharacterized membrane protein YhaH (DUF805 family)